MHTGRARGPTPNGARRVPHQKAAERTEHQTVAGNPVLRMGTPVNRTYFMCAPPT
ncbi:hypothetical protein RGQ21_03000 [Kitasatospora aureofaciens]|nr:hypothetical protein RGQ21_03000 [Kitasatospora aureofaciens]